MQDHCPILFVFVSVGSVSLESEFTPFGRAVVFGDPTCRVALASWRVLR